MYCTTPFILRDGDIRREVACGQCLSCRIKRSREWALRCVHEAAHCENSVFVTLTYDDDHLPSDGSLEKVQLQKFFKRLRYRLREHGRSIRYLASGEYGENFGRPHYHACIFGLHACGCAKTRNADVQLCSCPDRKLIHKCWGKGMVSRCGTVGYDSARYTADYIMKAILGKEAQVYEDLGIQKPFQVMSKGIGREHLKNETFTTQLRAMGTMTLKGVPIGVPRYYKDKLELEPRIEKNSGPSRARVTYGDMPIDIPLSDQRWQLHQNRFAKINMLKKGKL